MQQIWADLMDALSQSEIDWILENGSEERVASGTVLVEEDGEVDAIYILIEGLLHAKTRALGAEALAALGPGEIVGEISFVDRHRASASVEAAEDSLVLALPRAALDAHIETDDAFAAHFYRALAAIACRRLRATASRLGSVSPALDDEDLSASQDAEAATERFKRVLIDAEQAAEMAGGEVPEAVAFKVLGEFQVFSRTLHDAISEILDPPSALNQQIGRRVQNEVLPYISRTRLGERLYSKPRGYGGDFSSLELIYNNEPGGDGALGALLDRCLLEMPAMTAMRNRRALLAGEIGKTLGAARGDDPVRVMSIACGPATEVFDVFEGLEDPGRLESTLVDVDVQALLSISEHAKDRGLENQVRTTVKNLVYLALGRTELDAPEQDLIYSIGLVDYFNDKMTGRIIDHIHGLLRPGGRVLLGSFHPRNPDKALFDHVLEWPLFHRTEEDMNRLFQQSEFGRPATRVRLEREGIYLFAECVKEG